MPERRKNVDWSVARKDVGKDAGTYSYDAAQLAVLMDIRDEIRLLNAAMRKLGERSKSRATRTP